MLLLAKSGPVYRGVVFIEIITEAYVLIKSQI